MKKTETDKAYLNWIYRNIGMGSRRTFERLKSLADPEQLYRLALHLSPLAVSDEGFKDIVILPAGTNTPLDEKEKCDGGEDPEQRLLLQRNKWVIAYAAREPLIRQGAHPGVIGKNKELFYPGRKG